jgi:hypothetical protein
VCFVDSKDLGGSVVKGKLLGNGEDQICDRAVFGNEYVNGFLPELASPCSFSFARTYLFANTFTEPDDFHRFLGLKISQTCL